MSYPGRVLLLHPRGSYPLLPPLSLPVRLYEAHGEMVQRILYILHFLWAIVLAVLDGLTLWLNLLTKQYRQMSVVLCDERYFIIQQTQPVSSTQQQVSRKPSPRPLNALVPPRS